MGNIFSKISNHGWEIVRTFSDVFKFISDTTLSEALTIGSFPWTEAILEWIIDIFGWGDVTIMSLLIGSGITFVIVVTLIKWVIGIIT